MSKIIYKYEVPHCLGVHQVAMPVGAEVLDAQMQGERLFLWALVDIEAVKDEPRNHGIEVAFTGVDLPHLHAATRKHISTFQHNGFVFHVFQWV